MRRWPITIRSVAVRSVAVLLNPRRATFWLFCRATRHVSVSILLDAGRAEAGKAETIDGMLPGEEFLHCQRVTLAGIVQTEKAATHRRDHFRLAANDPAPRRRRG